MAEKEKGLKGIIFDMDGVLINSEPFHFRVWKETLKQRGITLDYEIYKPCIGSTIQFLMRLLHRHYGIEEKDEDLIREMKERKADLVEKEGYPPLLPHVKKFVRGLYEEGYALAVASSSPQSYIEQVTEAKGIRKYFNRLVSGESVENPKPAPDIFLKTAELLGLPPEDCLVIEDSENGCKAAKAAGMTCFAYYNPDSGKQDLSSAYLVAEGYEELDGAYLEKMFRHSRHLPALVCETSRLTIREMTKEDIPKLMEICEQETSQDALEGVAKPLSEELDNFETYRSYMYEICDMGFWVVSSKATGEIIGRAGVEPKFWNGRKTVVELGYVIDERYRGQGYAYEACQGILKEAAKRGAVYIHCRIKKNNLPSRSLAKKLGFVPIDYHLEGDDADMEVWRYTCPEEKKAVWES